MDVEFDNSCARLESKPAGAYSGNVVDFRFVPGQTSRFAASHSKTQGYAVGFACEEVANVWPRPDASTRLQRNQIRTERRAGFSSSTADIGRLDPPTALYHTGSSTLQVRGVPGALGSLSRDRRWMLLLQRAAAYETDNSYQRMPRMQADTAFGGEKSRESSSVDDRSGSS